MANHGRVIRKDKDITFDEMLKAINQINSEFFDNTLDIKVSNLYHGEKTVEILTINNYNSLYFFIGEDFDTEFKCAETRHDFQFIDLLWWLSDIFSKEIANILKGEWHDDGVGHIPREKWPETLSYKEFMKKKHFLSRMREKKSLKKTLTKEFKKSEFYKRFVLNGETPSSSKRKIISEKK